MTRSLEHPKYREKYLVNDKTCASNCYAQDEACRQGKRKRALSYYLHRRIKQYIQNQAKQATNGVFIVSEIY